MTYEPTEPEHVIIKVSAHEIIIAHKRMADIKADIANGQSLPWRLQAMEGEVAALSICIRCHTLRINLAVARLLGDQE